MKLFIATVLTITFALPALSLENGECVPISEADKMAEERGDAIVAYHSDPTGVFFLVRRKDGTFKELFGDRKTLQLCHIQDFIGDPRLTGAAL